MLGDQMSYAPVTIHEPSRVLGLKYFAAHPCVGKKARVPISCLLGEEQNASSVAPRPGPLDSRDLLNNDRCCASSSSRNRRVSCPSC